MAKPPGIHKTGLFQRAPREEPRILRLGWLGLKTVDLMGETLFLERILGLEPVDEGNSNTGHHVRYNCGALELELLSGGTAWATRPKPRRGYPDVPLIPSFNVNDIDKLVNHLRDNEVLTTQVFEQGWAASFYFLDAERNLWQANETRIEQAVEAEAPPAIATIWLAVEDYEASLQFYRDVLGLPLVDEAVRPRPITLDAELYQRENPPEDLSEFGFEVAENSASQEPISEYGAWESPQPGNGVTETTRQGAIKSQGAVFFESGARLALSPGGKRLADNAPRVWGKDSAFLPGLETNNLEGFAARLHSAGIKTSGPYTNFHGHQGHDRRHLSSHAAIHFYDPEGHCWQVYD
ncbi:MAG TPA: VOC family protein [Chloroflexia bacterium]|nr:VOC family protein [Chloroflexia bacterium]